MSNVILKHINHSNEGNQIFNQKNRFFVFWLITSKWVVEIDSKLLNSFWRFLLQILTSIDLSITLSTSATIVLGPRSLSVDVFHLQWQFVPKIGNFCCVGAIWTKRISLISCGTQIYNFLTSSYRFKCVIPSTCLQLFDQKLPH